MKKITLYSSRPLWLFSVLLSLVSCSNLDKRDNDKNGAYGLHDYADRQLSRAMKSGHMVGLSAAIIDKNGVLWSRGFGYTNKKEKALTTEKTLYRVGSITKLFTATAILQLAEQGTLNLDDAVSQHLPDFSAHGCFDNKAITIAQLLTHQSGLPHSYESGFWSRDDWRQLSSSLSCDMMLYPPNTQIGYSNIGYTLLGQIIEKVSGERYERYISKYIFSPMGMQSAGFEFDGESDKVLLEKLSHSYTYTRKYAVEPTLRDIPAGGMYANVGALAKFAQHMLNYQALVAKGVFKQEASAEQIFSSHGLSNALNMDLKIGWSWFLKPSPLNDGSFIAEHSGSNKYHHSIIQLLPKQGIAVILLANSGSRDHLSEVADKLMHYASLGEKRNQAVIPDTEKYEMYSEDNYCSQEKIPGYYNSEIGLVKVVAKGKHFIAHVDGRKVKLRRAQQHGYFDPVIYLLGIFPLGKMVFGDLQLSLRCTDSYTYAAIKSNGQQFSMAYKVNSNQTSVLNDHWLGEYRLQGKQSSPLVMRVTREQGEFFVTLEKFPVFEHNRQYLLSGVDANQARVLYLDNQGPMLRFELQGNTQMANYQGFTFVKLD